MNVATILVALTIGVQSLACDKQSSNSEQSLLKKVTHIFSKSSIPEQPFDLDFYKLLKEFPAEIKVSIWHEYNKSNGYIHNDIDHNFMIPFNQNFSQEFLEPHTKRYKDMTFWDNYNRHCDYPIRHSPDYDQPSGIMLVREENSPQKDKYPIHNEYGAGPSSQSNIKIHLLSDYPRLKTINEEYIRWQADGNLASKTSIFCGHPDKSQFIIGHPLSLLTVTNDSDSGQMNSECKNLAIPDEIEKKAKAIRFGPDSSIIIREREQEGLACMLYQYDYNQQKVVQQIDVEQLFNGYLQTNPVLHKKLYDRICWYMHRKKVNKKEALSPDCYLKNYSALLQHAIQLEDFVYPTAQSNYLLFKFNIKAPYCSCVTDKPYRETHKTCNFEDYFALYNIASKSFVYIGDKIYRGSRSNHDSPLPGYKTIKKSSMYTYVYDFINYQSNGSFHTFCYDDVLNTDDDQRTNQFPSRKMLAIVPDDDIARLEQMIIASIAHNWCKQEKAPTPQGYEILRYLMSETKNLEAYQNPFKQKRLFLLQRLAEQMAKKLNIDLQEHLKKHLNEN